MEIKMTNSNTTFADLGLSAQIEYLLLDQVPSDIVAAARQERLTNFDNIGPVRASIIVETLVASGYMIEETAQALAIRRFLAKVGVTPRYGSAEEYEKRQPIGETQVNCVINALNTLTPREEKILKMRFGLMDGKPMNRNDVGAEFNVTQERIRQIETRALRKMRHHDRLRMLWRGFPEYAKEPAQVPEELVTEDSRDQMPLEDLNLSHRAFTCLRLAGVTHVGHLRQMKETDLIHIRNFGRKCADEVIAKLQGLGLSLAS